MKSYYFVGGPLEGQVEAFLARLAEVGGPPPGWQIYAHISGDGRALHVVTADGEEAIRAHLALFGPIYEHGPIVEVITSGDPSAQAWSRSRRFNWRILGQRHDQGRGTPARGHRGQDHPHGDLLC